MLIEEAEILGKEVKERKLWYVHGQKTKLASKTALTIRISVTRHHFIQLWLGGRMQRENHYRGAMPIVDHFRT